MGLLMIYLTINLKINLQYHHSKKSSPALFKDVIILWLQHPITYAHRCRHE